MKIKIKEEKTIVYLYRYELSFDDLERLNTEIKNIFIKLIKNYHLNLHGFLKVVVYCNKNYGYVLEIEELYQDDDMSTLDLKLIINDKQDFYFKTDNYFLVQTFKKIYYYDNNFYVNLDEIDHLTSLIEHGDIVYELALNKCKLM